MLISGHHYSNIKLLPLIMPLCSYKHVSDVMCGLSEVHSLSQHSDVVYYDGDSKFYSRGLLLWARGRILYSFNQILVSKFCEFSDALNCVGKTFLFSPVFQVLV